MQWNSNKKVLNALFTSETLLISVYAISNPAVSDDGPDDDNAKGRKFRGCIRDRSRTGDIIPDEYSGRYRDLHFKEIGIIRISIGIQIRGGPGVQISATTFNQAAQIYLSFPIVPGKP